MNPNNDDYHNYGGRGITVCTRWDSWENFLEDMGLPTMNQTLDRKDSNGNYEKDNCRWTDITTQGRNRRGVVLSEDDVKMIHKLWCNNWKQKDIAARFGVGRSAIGHVINRRNWK